MQNQLKIPNRLRWACRRGMLELDVLLGNFLEEAYLNLSIAEQKDFIALLSLEDQILYLYLTGKAEPDLYLSPIVKKIRDHAYARHYA